MTTPHQAAPCSSASAQAARRSQRAASKGRWTVLVGSGANGCGRQPPTHLRRVLRRPALHAIPGIAPPCALVPPVHPLILCEQRVQVVPSRQKRQRSAAVCRGGAGAGAGAGGAARAQGGWFEWQGLVLRHSEHQDTGCQPATARRASNRQHTAAGRQAGAHLRSTAHPRGCCSSGAPRRCQPSPSTPPAARGSREAPGQRA